VRAGGRAAGTRAAAAERLQKVLSDLGVASRREAERWIRAGRLTVNGKTAVLGMRVSSEDHLKLDGRLIRQRAARAAPVLLCHRSPGEPLLPRPARGAAATAASTDARAAQRTLEMSSLAERMPRRLGRRFISVSPMPLIDGGLELLTADGALATRLQRSVRSLESEFSVRTRGELDAAALETLRQGRATDEAPLAVRALEAAGGESSNRWYRLLTLGASGHEVRRLFERHGIEVDRVLRTRLGGLALPRTLGRGQWRELERDELSALKAPAGSPDSGP
jgi:23S rRNA pseudouridine2605 synthase